MCRLLGFVADPPTTLAGLLGPDLPAFTALSAKHGDGWGVATATDGGVDVHKAADAARTSPAFAALAEQSVADLGLVHLRWATLGLATALDNTHPFSDGQVAFAHNGSISPPEALDGLVAPDLLAARRGDTDSERYFLALLTRLRAGEPVVSALSATVADVARVAHSSLNAMLVTPDALYAVCSYDPVAEQREEDGRYYRLHHRTRDGAVVVASSGWGSGWQELANDSVLVVQRGTGATTVYALGDVRAPA